MKTGQLFDFEWEETTKEVTDATPVRDEEGKLVKYSGEFCLRCDGMHPITECGEKEVGFQERVEGGDFWWVEGKEEENVKQGFKVNQWKIEGRERSER